VPLNLGASIRESVDGPYDRIGRPFYLSRGAAIDEPTAEERRRLIERYKLPVDALEAILFRADPIGIAEDNPHQDEYAAEASAIARLLPDVKDASDLERRVHEVFVDCFGEHSAGSRSAYSQIAREIWATWEELRSE
jgi:hypothetical protein